MSTKCRCRCQGTEHGSVAGAALQFNRPERSARWSFVPTPDHVEALYPGAVTIRDVGPWDQHLTVTNDAEQVVAAVVATGRLDRGQRLFFVDSSGALDELLITEERAFGGFAPGPDAQRNRS